MLGCLEIAKINYFNVMNIIRKKKEK